jgi:hypothetical protein
MMEEEVLVAGWRMLSTASTDALNVSIFSIPIDMLSSPVDAIDASA